MRIVVAALAGAVIVFIVSAILHMATPLGTLGVDDLLDVTKVPISGMTPMQLVLEFVTNYFAALIGAYVMSLSRGPRALIPPLLAVFAFLSVSASHWIWYKFPAAFSLAELATEVIAWAIAGVVMAKIVRA